MDYRVLGPLVAMREGRPLAMGGRSTTVLLCLFLLRPNEVVPTDRLVEDLWHGEAPARSQKVLQVYISRLRKVLGAAVLETRAPGYRLLVADGELDVWGFERLVTDGRRALGNGEPARAESALRRALALWRGPAFADVMDEPFARVEVARLEEQRLAAVEARVEADLALGRHADVVGELEALSRQHGARERLSAQFILALYRSGRQADALDVYHRTRRRLDDELGLVPGPELTSLETAILSHDPRLAWTPPRGSPGVEARQGDAFVGRRRELAEFREALDDLPRGRGSVFLLSGPAGIGKTRLAEEIAPGASGPGALV